MARGGPPLRARISGTVSLLVVLGTRPVGPDGGCPLLLFGPYMRASWSRPRLRSTPFVEAKMLALVNQERFVFLYFCIFVFWCFGVVARSAFTALLSAPAISLQSRQVSRINRNNLYVNNQDRILEGRPILPAIPNLDNYAGTGSAFWWIFDRQLGRTTSGKLNANSSQQNCWVGDNGW